MAARTQFLPRTTPEARGIRSSAVREFILRADAEIDHLHSVMLLRGGAVVAEGWWAPYAPERPHVLFSLSKSFTSTAVGFAVHEGLFSVDDRVISFFPESLPAQVSDNLAAMRVRDLLSMSTGNELDTLDGLFHAPDGDWVRAFLARPVERTPGTHFVYNSGATYMLSAIVQRRTGMRISDYLKSRLFEPLDIANPVWDRDPRGVDVGGWGLNITTEDIAHFGQLYLQNGVWHGRQVVPATWVAEATRAHSDNSRNENPDWAQGYGYQFWRCRHGAYRGDGAFGQFCIVLPEQDAVVAITSGVGDMQGVLNLIWETLLPAFGPAPLAEDTAAHTALRAQLAALEMPRPHGTASSPIAAAIDGRRYRLEPGPTPTEALSVEFGRLAPSLPISALDGLRRPADAAQLDLSNDDVALHLHTAHGTDSIAASFSGWRESQITFTADRPVRCASAAAWTDERTLQISSCLVETPFVRTHTVRFSTDGDTIELETELNVAFGPVEASVVKGSIK